MAGVDADFKEPLFEPKGAPRIAASRGKPGLGRLIDITLVKVGVEDVALQAFAGLLNDFGNALETRAERLGQDLLKGVAQDRIVGNLVWRDRLPRKKPAAVHCCDALTIDRDLVLGPRSSGPMAKFRLSVEWANREDCFSCPGDCPPEWLDS